MSPLVAVLLVGCKKSESPDLNSAPPSQPPMAVKPKATSVSHLYWLGKKRIAAQTNAASFMDIWNLPESARLEKQTLDKLSTAPWRLLRGETNANPASTVLRPLLDDLVQEESYLEIRQLTGQPAEIVFAIRLDVARAGLWHSNLAATVESLTSIRTTPSLNGRPGWSLKKHHAPNLLELARVGEWTVVGGAEGTNGLFGEILARIEHEHSPLSSPTTNHWLEASLDMASLAKIFSADWKLLENTPRFTLTVVGDGRSVRTEGDLRFPKPLTLEIDAWNIPTNLISELLIGFTAVRGIRPWLAALESTRGLFTGPPPNQVFLWTVPGLPSQTYFAAPMTDASNQVHALSTHLMDAVNPILNTNDMGNIGWAENNNGVTAQGIPFLSPFFRSFTTNGVNFAFGGTMPSYPILDAPSDDMLKLLSTWTNLVYLDWEVTGDRIVTWLYLGQLFRMVSKKPQIPFGSAAIAWTKAAEAKLGYSDTMVTRTDPVTLHFLRKSTIGFTALELHFLADWLESPQFPRGLHTFTGSTNMPSGEALPPAAPPAK